MRRVSPLALALLVLPAIGCVAQADYDQLMAQNKALASEKEALAQRALDAESQADALRDQVMGKEREYDLQKAMSTKLQNENDRIHDAFKRQQDIMSDIDLDPDAPVVIQTILPPALDKALRSFASAHPDVEYDPSRGVVKWKSDLLFASGSDVVRQDAASTLRSFSEIVNANQGLDFDIVVTGHTDNDPIVRSKDRHPTNWHLSVHRSIAVARELMNAQVAPQRVGVMGYSEFRPVASNTNNDGKSKNRRVEIFIVGRGALASDTTGTVGGVVPASSLIEPPQK